MSNAGYGLFTMVLTEPTSRLLKQIVLPLMLAGLCAASFASAKNFTRGAASARLFGVHEIELRGDSAAGDPFGRGATVRFTPPSGRAVTVEAFYDGDSTWRGRAYISEKGRWRWQSSDGQSGAFDAGASDLPGMLRRHRDNPRQWMTDNGRWFPNISDTAYFLFHPEQPDWRQYITDCAALGITSVRTWAVPSKTANVSNEWDDVCAAPDCSRLRLEKFRTSDERLEWMLDNFPAMYVQIILFPRAARWRQDETAWAKLPAATRTMLMRYMLARFGAYPQIFWLVVNDAHYGPQFPNNNAMAKEVGEYFQRHDPWQHLLSTGPARFEPFPFRDAPWVSYYHIEDEFDLSAERIEQYRADPVHVFLGEDRYEQDRARRDPKHPRYFFRCLFWAWLVAGGSANYGGRWPVIDPYTLTASRPHVNAYGKGPDGKTYTARLSGLDSVAHIRKFLDSRDIDLARFQPDDAALGEVDHAAKLPRPKLTRRGADEYLVYHPNAHSAGIEAAPDAERTPRIRIDLSQTSGSLRVEWLRAEDGAVQSGGTMNAGEIREFTSPWKGHDVVLYLRR